MATTEEHLHHEDVGIVTEVMPKAVRVEIQRGAGCKSCSMRGFCFSKNTPAVFVIPTELSLKTGDRVELEISPANRVLASLLIFILPVVFLFIGYIAAHPFVDELWAALAGFGFMGLSYIIMRLIDRKFGSKMNCSIGGLVMDEGNQRIQDNEDNG